jgi:ribonuclease-3
MPSTDDVAKAEDLKSLEKRLGYVFSNKRRLERALTHRSAGAQGDGSYERLEFLGDRVLGLVIADMLLQRFPKDPEGHLSRRFNALVRQETLADVARDLGLGGVIRFGQYEEAEGSDNPAILSDVCEALIAALYRDAGLDCARDFILRNWETRLDADPTPPRDGKSALQEWTMARGLGLPQYEEVSRSGPDHAPIFTMRVSIPKHGSAQAEGRVKRHAEQSAAEQLLESLKHDG